MSVWRMQGVGMTQFWKSDINNKCMNSIRFLCEMVILVHEHEQDKAVLKSFWLQYKYIPKKYCPGVDP